jgi:hypothetical protein
MLFRAALTPIEPIAYNWAPCRGYLLHAVQVHTTTRCRFYREQLGPTPPMPGPGAIDITRSCILSVLSYFILVGCKDVDYCGHTIFCVLVTSTNIQYTGTIPQRKNNNPLQISQN